jgi:hypothetical protein
MAVQLSALRTGRTLLSRKIIFSAPEPSTAGRIRKLKNFKNLIESRTRDLAACSIVPQPIRYQQKSLKTNETKGA